MKICILHRFPKDRIKETNASITFLLRDGVVIKTFRKFDRMNPTWKLLKSLIWILYAPLLVIFRSYDIIYCDDSFPFYAGLVKFFCPKSKVIIRLGDLHLMYYLEGRAYDFAHWLEVKEWKFVDDVIPISQTMSNFIYKETGLMFQHIKDPVNLDDFDIKPDPHKDPPIVMFHGTITRNKGLDKIIRASHKLPDVRFIIVGEGEDRQRLESFNCPNVRFTGWIPYSRVKECIAKASIGLAMRSHNRGNQYVVTSAWLQYCAVGIPCIVSERDVFKDMEYPWTFNTVERLVVLIKNLLEKPENYKSYVTFHHDARKIGDKIWFRLLSSVEQSPRN